MHLHKFIYRARSGRLDVVKYLVGEKNADLTVQDNYGRAALDHAVRSGSKETVEYLKEMYDVYQSQFNLTNHL